MQKRYIQMTVKNRCRIKQTIYFFFLGYSIGYRKYIFYDQNFEENIEKSSKDQLINKSFITGHKQHFRQLSAN